WRPPIPINLYLRIFPRSQRCVASPAPSARNAAIAAAAESRTLLEVTGYSSRRRQRAFRKIKLITAILEKSLLVGTTICRAISPDVYATPPTHSLDAVADRAVVPCGAGRW